MSRIPTPATIEAAKILVKEGFIDGDAKPLRAPIARKHGVKRTSRHAIAGELPEFLRVLDVLCILERREEQTLVGLAVPAVIL